VEVKYFEVQAGDHPHDVAPAPNGSVWYTGQGAGVLGRLDPKSGQVERIRLGEGSAPHGVIVGPDGAAWVTDSGLNAILRVDPTTKEVKTWPLPKERANANLNTAAFDGNGHIWFTGQSGIYGRLDPATGKMDVWDAPRGRGPYGITATPDGAIYYVSLAGSFLGKLDLETGETAVIEPETKGVGTRRIWSDSKGRLWVSEWNAGNLSVYDPTAKDWKVYKLPGDEPHAYAGAPAKPGALNPAPTALWSSAIAIKKGGTSRHALRQREDGHEAEQSCRGDRDDQGGKRPPVLRLGGWPRGEFHLTLRARSREQRRGMFLTPFWARPAHIV
jgi:virginiamycin B lyase